MDLLTKAMQTHDLGLLLVHVEEADLPAAALRRWEEAFRGNMVHGTVADL